MKKIVSNKIIVGAQLLVGGLFLLSIFAKSNASIKVVFIDNINSYKLSDAVKINNLKEEINEIENEEKEEDILSIEEEKEEIINIDQVDVVDSEIINDYDPIYTLTGTLTGYGANCYGCSGITGSGYDVRETITYYDSEYGDIRVVAADPSIPYYSIVRIIGVSGMDPIIAIVLDRGSDVGFERVTLFDLLCQSESEAVPKTDNITFEILREGN